VTINRTGPHRTAPGDTGPHRTTPDRTWPVTGRKWGLFHFDDCYE